MKKSCLDNKVPLILGSTYTERSCGIQEGSDPQCLSVVENMAKEENFTLLTVLNK